jgi:hypothetical protein
VQFPATIIVKQLFEISLADAIPNSRGDPALRAW